MIDTKHSKSTPASLGEAMQFVLGLAGQRAGERAVRGATAHWDNGSRTALLWDLAERYHPEETWLAESHLRGERTLEELRNTAPRGALADAVVAAVPPWVESGYEPPTRQMVARAEQRGL